MKQYEVFPNAPITEAILDIRVELSQEVTLTILEKFYQDIENQMSLFALHT